MGRYEYLKKDIEKMKKWDAGAMQPSHKDWDVGSLMVRGCNAKGYMLQNVIAYYPKLVIKKYENGKNIECCDCAFSP